MQLGQTPQQAHRRVSRSRRERGCACGHAPDEEVLHPLGAHREHHVVPSWTPQDVERCEDVAVGARQPTLAHSSPSVAQRRRGRPSRRRSAHQCPRPRDVVHAGELPDHPVARLSAILDAARHDSEPDRGRVRLPCGYVALWSGQPRSSAWGGAVAGARKGRLESWPPAVPRPRSAPASSLSSAPSTPSRRRRSLAPVAAGRHPPPRHRRRHAGRVPDPAGRDLERRAVGHHRPHARRPGGR